MVFDCRSRAELLARAAELGVAVPWSDDLSVLGRPFPIPGTPLVVPNRFAVHPMEGSDGADDGAPSEWTMRRYERFAEGGAGLLWFEAVAVVPEGRAVPRQLRITRANLHVFAAIRRRIDEVFAGRNPGGGRPVVVVQLTHSGRFSKPEGRPAPRIAWPNPVLDPRAGVPLPIEPVTDDYLDALPDRFAETALLCREAGFDGVDVKACHRYLISELLGARERPGRYGGSFENRARLLLDAASRIRAAVGPDPGFLVATRLNLFDGIRPPYGFGTDAADESKPDLAEPLELVGRLRATGVRLVNVTMGSPYINPHVNRPYVHGGYEPPEHPLVGVARLIAGAAAVQRAHPDVAVVGTGYSWLRHLAPQVAAGAIASGGARFAGFGRLAFADPGFAGEVLREGGLDPRRCCVACGKCSELLRAGEPAGCVVRDGERYLEPYRRIGRP